MNGSPTGRMMEATSKQLRTPHYQPSAGAQRVIDMYREVQESSLVDTDLAQLECGIYGMDFGTEHVLAMPPRSLGAPYGTVALRQCAKRERIHARLRIARKGH